MKKLIITAVILVFFIGAALLYGVLKEEYAPAPAAGQTDRSPAPDFTVYDEEGNAVCLSNFAGKPVVLNFWASWCYYCKVEMPDFNEAFLRNPDVQFMMVNVTDGRQETLSSAKRFLEGSDYDFPVFYDTDLDAASRYGASSLPMTFFIDENGGLVTYARGMLTAEGLAQGLSMLLE